MLKKTLIITGIIITLAAAAMFYLNHRNRTLSHAGKAEISAQGLNISVEYSRPSVRDRQIFGPTDEAIQVYGAYWRFGANESTEITVDKDFMVNGIPISAGRYKIYAFPGEKEFEIGFSKDIGNWGYSEPDYELDVARFKVPVQYQENTEQFTISLKEASDGINLIAEFEKLSFQMSISAAS